MRFAFAVPALVCLFSAAACSSSSSGGSGTGPAAADDPTKTSDPTTPVAETPLAARPVCATVPLGENFGKGCSGTGMGQKVCALSDPKCGADKCVYDTRGSKFAFTCGAKCVVGDVAGCPLGFECVAPDASCAGDAAAGVCSKRVDTGCDAKVKVPSGRFVEGANGEAFHLSVSADTATLRVRSGSSFQTLATWKDPYASEAVATRSNGVLLLSSTTSEVVVASGAATPITFAARRAAVVGAMADGTFVKLESTGSTASFAAVSHRNADGTWTEVGPTKKRVSNLAALGTGFAAVCADGLCVSRDGETFDPILAPPGVTLGEKTKLVVAGTSADDLFASVDNVLFHFRKGSWVKEGPHGLPVDPTATTTYPDRLSVSAKGVAVYATWNGKRLDSYVARDSCWGLAGTDVTAATLVGDTFLSTGTTSTSSETVLCSAPIE